MTLRTNVALVILLIVGATGCAGIPAQELSQYRTAFAAAQQASTDILIDFAAAKAAAEKRAAAPNPRSAALAFPTDLGTRSGKQPDAIEVRRMALRTIDKFNNVLATLAEGKSVEAVQSTAGALIQVAAKFAETAAGVAVPGLSAVTSAVKTLVGELEKARLREEFESAVRRGAPVVDQILTALIEDRAEHITLRADEANLRQVALLNEITVLTGRAVLNVVSTHSAPPPPGDDPLPAMQAALDQALEAAKDGLSRGLLPTLKYSSSASDPPFGAGQRAMVDSAIIQIRDRVARYQSNKESYSKLRNALTEYGSMLEATRSALQTLVASLDKPVQFEQVSEQLFQVVFSLKRDVEAFKAARNAAE